MGARGAMRVCTADTYIIIKPYNCLPPPDYPSRLSYIKQLLNNCQEGRYKAPTRHNSLAIMNCCVFVLG